MLTRFKKQRHKRRKSPEGRWGEDHGDDIASSDPSLAPATSPSPWRTRLALVLLLLMVGGCLTVLLRFGDKRSVAEPPPTTDEDLIKAGVETAESVARAFLVETDPAKRLLWVRNADQVKSNLSAYPDEARQTVGVIESMLGHQESNERSITAFVVAFPTGNLRLLEVVGTDDGPRVDWDAYARYGTATWQDLWAGKAQRALVRVFCEPATERPEPFADRQKWTCFRLSSPDLPQPALGFAEVGSMREKMMKRVVLGSPRYRQRFTLEIVRHEGAQEPLFEIARCVAVGWVADEVAVEEVWEKEVPEM